MLRQIGQSVVCFQAEKEMSFNSDDGTKFFRTMHNLMCVVGKMSSIGCSCKVKSVVGGNLQAMMAKRRSGTMFGETGREKGGHKEQLKVWVGKLVDSAEERAGMLYNITKPLLCVERRRARLKVSLRVHGF